MSVIRIIVFKRFVVVDTRHRLHACFLNHFSGLAKIFFATEVAKHFSGL